MLPFFNDNLGKHYFMIQGYDETLETTLCNAEYGWVDYIGLDNFLFIVLI
jgi:hypothetical protein